MSMINTKDILETIKMIEEEHLDIRTITMGISLRDLAADDINVLADKIYDKVTRRAEKLVATGEQIERELGIPIINKRISVTPIAMVGATSSANSYVPLAKALDRAAATTGVNFVGGFSALVQKGFAKGDEILINSIPEAMAETNLVCSSVNVASTKAGVNLDAIGLMGRIIKQTAELTKDNDSMGCSKLVVFANAVDDNPFMAGAFHGIGEPETVINVGVSGPGVVQSAIRRAGDCSIGEVADVIKKTAFKITRMGQLVGALASQRLGVPFGIVDLSLAPTPAIGDSVARILEEVGLEVCGGCGTTAILAMLNDAVKKGGVMASSSVGGLHPGIRGRRHDRGRTGRRAHARKARGHDRCLLGRHRHGSCSGRHHCGGHLRPHRGRDCHRRCQQQDHRRPRHPGHRQEGRRHGRIRRPARRRSDHAHQDRLPGEVHWSRRPHPGPDPEPQELILQSDQNCLIRAARTQSLRCADIFCSQRKKFLHFASCGVILYPE